MPSAGATEKDNWAQLFCSLNIVVLAMNYGRFQVGNLNTY